MSRPNWARKVRSVSSRFDQYPWATLGPAISAAFVATLIGVASANVIYLPISARMKQLSQAELHARALVVEGVLAIQAGDNPRVVADKLEAFVPPEDRKSAADKTAAAPAKAAAPKADPLKAAA